MRTLIVEDDFTSRLLIQELLKTYGPIHIAVTGGEAVDAVRAALGENQPYDLICLDIMMPEMDGQQALREIRALEEDHGIFSPDGCKIIMTTALTDMKDIMESYHNLCDAYLNKPIRKEMLLDELSKLKLLP